MVDINKGVEMTDLKPGLRVALRNDSYALHMAGPRYTSIL